MTNYIVPKDLRIIAEEKVPLKIFMKPVEKQHCTVCMGDDEGKVNCYLKLDCGHFFHLECSLGWVRENNSCPLCREKMLGKNYDEPLPSAPPMPEYDIPQPSAPPMPEYEVEYVESPPQEKKKKGFFRRLFKR